PGTGLDPAAISLTVDGRDVTARGVLAGGRFAYVPAEPLGYGSHSVSARATDRSGNVSPPLTWSFQVRDETPPVIAQRSPLPGSTVVGATPIGFAVSDDGTGVDDDTLRVTVDGSNQYLRPVVAGLHEGATRWQQLSRSVPPRSRHARDVLVPRLLRPRAGPRAW